MKRRTLLGRIVALAGVAALAPSAAKAEPVTLSDTPVTVTTGGLTITGSSRLSGIIASNPCYQEPLIRSTSGWTILQPGEKPDPEHLQQIIYMLEGRVAGTIRLT